MITTPRENPSLERLQQELAQKSEEVRVLRKMSSEVNATLNLDEIYEAVLGTMYDLFGFRHSLILLLDDPGETLSVVASRGYQDEAVGAKVQVGVGVIGMVARRRTMMRVGNLGQSRSYAAAVRSEMALSEQADKLGAVPKLPGLPNAESQIAIPLIIKDRLVGVFAVESAERRVFSERDETLVSVVANLSASAIHNALLYRKQEEYGQSLAEKVSERTQLLAQRNQELEQALQELKETQNQLVIQEKMASLGNLVAGVSHEINTPVGAINSMQDTMARAVSRLKKALEGTLLQDQGDKRDVCSALQLIADANHVIAEGTQRVTALVGSLRSFARLDEAELKMADIHAGLRDTLRLVRHEFKDRISVSKNFGSIPQIVCYPSRLNQVFLNLLINSKEAIRGNGRITITTFHKNGKIHLIFKDTGVGIPQDRLQKVFEPGFTIRGTRVGTRLGLATCYQIVTDHGGDIRVDSRVGEGSTFTITLPTNLERRVKGWK